MKRLANQYLIANVLTTLKPSTLKPSTLKPSALNNLIFKIMRPIKNRDPKLKSRS